MKLTVVTPLGTVLKSKIKKVMLETLNGYYTLLPKHVDFAAAVRESIVVYTPEDEAEKYVACHHGIAVKKGEQVTISVQDAVIGDTLDELGDIINREFKQNDEKRKELNSAMARLELGIIRGFGQLNRENGDGGL